MPHRYVIFVDDDRDDRELLGEAFEALAVRGRTRVFSSGAELLAFLASVPNEAAYPSLIVLDVNMPPPDGEETLVRLKGDPRFRSIPVVMFSTGDLHRERFLARGAVGYYTKPFSFTELLQNVGAILGRTLG